MEERTHSSTAPSRSDMNPLFNIFSSVNPLIGVIEQMFMQFCMKDERHSEALNDVMLSRLDTCKTMLKYVQDKTGLSGDHTEGFGAILDEYTRQIMTDKHEKYLARPIKKIRLDRSEDRSRSENEDSTSRVIDLENATPIDSLHPSSLKKMRKISKIVEPVDILEVINSYKIKTLRAGN